MPLLLRVFLTTAAIAAVVSVSAAAGTAPQQVVTATTATPWCRPADGQDLNRTRLIYRWFVATDSGALYFRTQLGLTDTMSVAAVRVSDDSLCALASAAVDSVIHEPRGLPVVVYRVGAFYAVDEPNKGGGYNPMWFFDTTFVHKGSFAY